jgi:hypothetical protein
MTKQKDPQMTLLAGDKLYDSIPAFGMTGTTEGATQEQMTTLAWLATNEAGLDFMERFYWHFGDAIGADKQCFDWVTTTYPFQAITIAHPGIRIGAGNEKRAFCKAYEIRQPMLTLGRNAVIAYGSYQGLFVLPRTFHEVMRSGTWTTARRTHNFKRPCWIIRPDGSYLYYPEGYMTELNRQAATKDDVEQWL